MPCIVEFKECAACAAKPGSPQLCASCLSNRKVIEAFKFHLREKRCKKDPKRFRIKQISVNSVQCDSEPIEREPLGRGPGEDWEDIVVSITDTDGSRFEVARIPVQKNGLVGESTYVATLKCARSWGTEEDDDSVSCPLCYFQGHGAGACGQRRYQGEF